MACPDENEIVAFATGDVPPGSVARLQAHIDSCAECAELVAEAVQAEPEPAVDSLGHTPVGLPSPGAESTPARAVVRGTSLGRYVVLELLAAGGLGVVYVAYDPKLDRKVALKILRPSAAHDQDEQKWLLREAQAMAKLSHPNVVPVHDVGMFESSVFVAMELIEGRTFTKWVREEKRSWRDVRDLLLDAARGLMAAHAAGMVHRDFKPSNILVGDDGRVRVVDFGLARTVEGLASEPRLPSTSSPDAGLVDQSLTATGSVVGTPAFMPPEQFRGADVGFQADQFAFCVTLYFGLYGLRPFQGNGYLELRDAILAGEIQTPPTDRDVPAWLHQAVLRGLRAKAAERFPSMEALLAAITRDERKRNVQWFAVALSLVVSTAGASFATLALQPEPSASERARIDAIVEEARAAAERAAFVYPPSEDPELATAYEHIVALESIDGPSAELGKAAAAQLRIEFAEALRVLGKRYWDKDGGDAFAADYYSAAVLFDPDDAVSRARMRLTPVQFAAFEVKAKTAGFSETELEAADMLAALAEPDPALRADKVDDVRAGRNLPLSVQAQLDALEPKDEEPPARVAAAEPEPSPEVVEASPARDAPKPRPKTKAEAPTEQSPPAADPDAPRDVDAAAREVALGKQAAATASWRKAARHFHAALEFDARSRDAAGGLLEAHFELTEFGLAVRYGKRAIALAPKNAGYRITLGDAYSRLLRYGDARKQYDKASTLGSKAAAGRLRKLDEKTRALDSGF